MKIILNKLTFKFKNNKNWIIRAYALVITVLCVFNIKNIGSPRPLYISIIGGILYSTILNLPLWLSSFKWIRVRLKHLISFLIFLSSLGVFFAVPWLWYFQFIIFAFHIWFIYSLIQNKETI